METFLPDVKCVALSHFGGGFNIFCEKQIPGINKTILLFFFPNSELLVFCL